MRNPNPAPDWITELADNQVFVYGDNESHFRGAGAALIALKKFGAINGESGLVGKSYGISTKDKYLRVLPLNKIKEHIEVFVHFAANHPELEFLCTLIGTGLSEIPVEDIKSLWPQDLPNNIRLPRKFF